ncbi:MAG TPA: tetratricopeptide repeat protein, partial [Lacipirellulaceae bacterium]
ALVAAALIVGSVVSVSQAVQASRERANAEVIADKARQAVDDMYTQVAEKWLAHQPQMEPVQRAFLEKALRFYTEFAKETSNDPSIHFETARAYRRIAEIQHRLGQPSQAEEAFRQAIDQTQALVDEFPTNSAYRADLTDTLHKFGVLLGDTGRYQEEETIHRRALALDEQLAADFPTNLEYRRDLGRGHWYVAQVFAAMHQRDAAVQTYRKAIGIQKQLVAEFPSSSEYREHLAESLFGLGTSVRLLGATQEYEQALDEAADLLEQLAAEFPSLPGYRNQLAKRLLLADERTHRTRPARELSEGGRGIPPKSPGVAAQAGR